MARALLLALTWAAAASASRYVDYSGVKMPVYGSAGDYEAPREAAHPPPSEDYHGHSPDAPASLDYKYEEEPRIKTETPPKDSEDSEGWRKSGRKQRGLMRPMEGGVADVGRKFDREEEDVPKFRFSYRNPKHRSRLKNDALPRQEDAPPRRPIKYNRDRKDDVSDIDRKDYFHVDKEDFTDDKSKEFDDDVKFMNEATTRRLSRRKARDRHVKRKNSDFDLPYDEDFVETERRTKLPEVEKDERPRVRPGEVRARYRPVIDDDEDDPSKVQPIAKKHPSKTYEDYDDYYDMKRVYNIKNKLPSLLRRTSVRFGPPTPTSLLELLMPNRRKLGPIDDTDAEDTTEILSTKPRTSSATTTPRTGRTTTTKATPPTATTTDATSTTTTTTTTTTTSTTTEQTTTVNTAELSLAEKSRLSIMKKDQRKEGLHFDPKTKKPPVLLQVTRVMPTVVMVEPPSSLMPWMRALELEQDSPQRIEKVKKLMRHKLVAEARSIHDLTDKWDEMVCDYIDVSMLENGSAPVRVSLVLALAHALRLFII